MKASGKGCMRVTRQRAGACMETKRGRRPALQRSPGPKIKNRAVGFGASPSRSGLRFRNIGAGGHDSGSERRCLDWGRSAPDAGCRGRQACLLRRLMAK